MKKVLILGGILIVVAATVCVVLFTTSGANYGDAISKTERILDSKSVVTEVLDSDLAVVSNYSDTLASSYAEKVNETKTILDELRSSKACSGKYKDKCDELGTSFEKINQSAEIVDVVSKFVQESKDIAGVSNDTLSAMKNSSNEFIRNMATDLSQYRDLVNAFEMKYHASADDTEYVADYSRIADKEAELKEKYSSIDNKKLYGASTQEMLAFYDKVEELKNAFAEEK